MFCNTFEHYTAVTCGLVSFTSTATKTLQDDDGDIPIAVSLESVDVQATLVHAAAEVTITQAFVNNLDQSIDTYYFFPVHLEDAVTGFEVEIEGCILKNIVLSEEVRNSKSEYEEAVRRNPRRFWLNPKVPDDLYMTRVGFLKPRTRAVVNISYVTEVKLVSQKIQLQIPNTVVPFYNVFQKSDWTGQEENESDVEFVDISDPSFTVKISVEIFLEGEGSIISLGSPSHVLQKSTIGHLPDKENWSTGIVEFVGQSTDMDRDFVLSVGAANILSPRLYLEESPDEIVMMSTFCPLLAVSDSPKCEIIFAVESLMTEEQNSTETLELTLDVLLQSLPTLSTFNVIGRGTCLREFVFSQAVSFDEDNLNKAILATSASAHSLNISQGELDTASLLEKVFTENTITDSPKQIILMLQKNLKEDELEKLITLVKFHTQCRRSRLFVIGIGNKLSRRSIQKLANAGEGRAILIPNADPDWHATALTAIEFCCAPSFKDITLNWSEFIEREKQLNLEPSTKGTGSADADLEIVDDVAIEAKSPWMQIPDVPTPVFNGTQFVSFGIFVGNYFPRALNIQGISYQTSAESLQYNYNIQLNESRGRHVGSIDTITKLAYAKGLKQLEDNMRQFSYGSRRMRFEEERTKERIMQIACREGIPSKYTGFSTINVETGEEVTGHWTRQTRYCSNNVASRSNAENAWSGGIAYGSIARKKLGFIRKLQEADSIKPKIPRTVIGEVVDLTNEQDDEPVVFPVNTELIILD